MKGCDRGRLTDMLKQFARQVETLCDRTPAQAVPALLSKIERELEIVAESQIKRIV